MTDSPLQTPVQFVKGVGPHRAELLTKLDVRTAEDLLFYVPCDVLDLSHVTPAEELQTGEMQTVRGHVVDRDGRTLKDGKTISAVLLDCGNEYVRGVWFNQTWVLQKFQPNAVVLFSGKPKRNAGRWEISHPRIQWLDEEDSQSHGGILPRYGLTEGLKMHELRRITRRAVEDFVEFVPELLPETVRTHAKLPGIRDAIRFLHVPASIDEFNAGRRRLIWQDLLEFQLGLALRRRSWRQRGTAPKFPTTAKIDARIRRLLPFQLTGGQEQAIREVCADLDSGFAMHRLLQADVGAGKTVVAVYAMLVTVAAEYQAVMMAPTELLASQHWRTVDRLLAHSRVKRQLLTGSLTAAERRDALTGIRSGETQLIVGTQAIIQKDVEFGKLGLVVIDEQHKFGVMQRAHFAAGGSLPHTLVMTATPIPRSLCLTQFGDLDLSVMTELPPGRQKIVTSRVPPGPARTKAWEFIRERLRSGRQAFVVCPRISASEGSDSPSDAAAAEQVFEQLSVGELRGFRVALLHGQLDARQKAAVMESFRRGQTQVIVATTVVEVGVDVPNATLMIVYSAERFGISQLHQLRGRISRGNFQGYCFLISESADPETADRLRVLEENAGGFEVAEADFRFRGPGDILGTRQHGEMPLQFADLTRDQAELTDTRTAAFDLVQSGAFDTPPFAALKRRVMDRFGCLFDLAGGG